MRFFRYLGYYSLYVELYMICFDDFIFLELLVLFISRHICNPMVDINIMLVP